jgi:hypothetical protein
MQFFRRRFFHLATAVMAAPVLPQPATALDYRQDPVRCMVGIETPAKSAPDGYSAFITNWRSG